MKNMLLTTTALIAFAGAAAADGHTSITWGGAATVGIAREGGAAAVAGGTNVSLAPALEALIADDGLAADTTWDDLFRGEYAAVVVDAGLLVATTDDETVADGTGALTAAEKAAIVASLNAARAQLVADGLALTGAPLAANKANIADIDESLAVFAMIMGSPATATGEFDTYAEVSLTATGSVDMGNGVTITGAVSVDAGTGYDFADDDGFDAVKKNGVSLDYITVDGGAMGALTFDKNDIAHLVDGDDDANGDIKYSNTFGNATVAFVMDMSKDTDPTARRASLSYVDLADGVLDDPLTIADETVESGLIYNAAVAADVAWSAKLNYVVNDSISVYAAFDEGKGNAFGGSYSMNGMTVSVDSKLEALEAELKEDRSNTIAVSYAVAGFTAGASYNTIKDGNQWGVNAAYAADGMSVAYSTNEGEEWTATAGYELSDAASITAGVNYTEDAFVGVSFTF